MLPDEIQPFSHTISDLQVRRVCCKFYTRLLQFVNRTPGARNLYSQGSTGEKVLNCFLPLRLQSKEKWPFLNSNILLSCHPCMRARCRSSRVRLFVTPWIAALQAPLSMEVFGQEYWDGLPCPPAGHLPDPGSPTAPAPQADSLLLSQQGSPSCHTHARKRLCPSTVHFLQDHMAQFHV